MFELKERLDKIDFFKINHCDPRTAKNEVMEFFGELELMNVEYDNIKYLFPTDESLIKLIPDIYLYGEEIINFFKEYIITTYIDTNFTLKLSFLVLNDNFYMYRDNKNELYYYLEDSSYTNPPIDYSICDMQGTVNFIELNKPLEDFNQTLSKTELLKELIKILLKS